ncbi:MAG: LruC domain-containing protein [Bacteroidales bacterium]|nr:LruC domain-containing protein [Bacteroidales bacterium]
MKMNTKNLLTLAGAGLLITACTSEPDIQWNNAEKPEVGPSTPVSDRDEAFINAAGGAIDPDHTWISATTLPLSISAQGACEVNLYTRGIPVQQCLGRFAIQDNGDITAYLPQGYMHDVLVELVDAQGEKYYELLRNWQINGKTQAVDFAAKMVGNQSRGLVASRNVNNPDHLKELTTKSYEKNFGYQNFDGDLWDKLLVAAPEGGKKTIEADTAISLNFQLVSRGPFYVSFAYGETGTPEDCILGYYHYDEKNMSGTFEMVPLVEAIRYDYQYYNEGEAPKSKVQYALNNAPSDWKDVNFNYHDIPGATTGNLSSYRKNDDVYKVKHVYDTHKGNINQVRGLRYQVNAPEGHKVGFYLARKISTEGKQYKDLQAKGISTSVLDKGLVFGGKKYNATFSDARFNYKTNNYRSLIKFFEGFIFMGLDDNPEGGDWDCNDVTFCLVKGNGKSELPGVIFPLIEDFGNPTGKPDYEDPKYLNPDGTKTEDPKDVEYLDDEIPWTFAFEDKPTSSDFDYNDVVIQVVPNSGKKTAKVYLCATGGTLKTEIWWRDQMLCSNTLTRMGRMTNTGANTTKDRDSLTTIELPEKYSFSANAADFKIKVYDGDEIRTIDIATRAQEGAQAPMAIMLKYFWQWPTEGTSIFDAYSEFAGWAQNQNNPKYERWYEKEKAAEGTTTYSQENGKATK